MTDPLNEDQQTIESYLVKRARDGKQYFKAKYIAAALDMTPHSVGVNLSQMQERTERVSIEIFSGQSSGSTWLVTIDDDYCRDTQATGIPATGSD